MSRLWSLQRLWRRLRWLVLALLLLLGALATQLPALRQAGQAYLFALPLVLMDLTREHHRQRTGEENALSLARQFPTAQFKEVVRPNLDTLYATAFLDLAAGPWLLEMPPNGQRYEMVAFLDAWTDVFAAPGTRTHGDRGGRYLLVGPQWSGPAEPGLTVLQSPSRSVWLIGRIQALGDKDLPTVHALQDRWRLQRWPGDGGRTAVAAGGEGGDRARAHEGAPEVANEGAKDRAKHSAKDERPPLLALAEMDTPAFYARAAELLRDNPPRAADAAIVAQLRGWGIEAGRAPDIGPWRLALLRLGRWLAWRVVHQELAQPSKHPHGWKIAPFSLGRFGVDYPTRAAVAIAGLGANLAEDTVYAQAGLDARGRPLHGSQRYRIRFAAGQWPPVSGFWSVTAYDGQGFLLDHPSGRHAARSTDALHVQADGSLELWVQSEPPPEPHRANWVPVLAGQAFNLNLRLYGPQEAVLGQRWPVPAIEPRP